MAAASVLEKVIEEVRSGLVSSVAAEAILFPLDTVKLRQQVHGGGAVTVLRQILLEHGAIGLYQGLLGRLIQTITSNVGFFIWQTIFVQLTLQRIGQCVAGARTRTQLGTGLSLVVNMLAQQFNRVLTTPIDVVANVNQADPNGKGFFYTFVKLARTGGRAVLWRGLGVSLLLSLNPALMFTLVGKLSAFVSVMRNSDCALGASDMFWISGFSKAVATLVTYPLIRAKAVIQSTNAPSGLWVMLADIAKTEGVIGLYHGVWMMSYKTVLFNSLMMALKQKVTLILKQVRRLPSEPQEGSWREKVMLVHGTEKPWLAAARGASVIYVDGSWSFLHVAQEHFLRQAAQRADHLVVGVHSDECHHAAVGTWPTECCAARMARLREHPVVTSILEAAPWDIGEDLIRQLGITKVLGGSVTKLEDCKTPKAALGDEMQRAPSHETTKDPYEECKRLGLFEEVPSPYRSTEHDAWVRKVTRVVFSNVDASIDWRILVADGDTTQWGENPGYSAGTAQS
mmetsp:Transcript_141589/g.394669  ORF Transcript_141589/g.394669 Transcript_141589/m.394669 type:complete len:512 (-) Transcript_141589:93-1628(-)